MWHLRKLLLSKPPMAGGDRKSRAARRNSELRPNLEHRGSGSPGEWRCSWMYATFQELSLLPPRYFSLHNGRFSWTLKKNDRKNGLILKQRSWLLPNRLSIGQPINSTWTIHSAGKKQCLWFYRAFDFWRIIELLPLLHSSGSHDSLLLSR